MSPGGRDVLRGSGSALPPLARYTQIVGAATGLILGLVLLIDFGEASFHARWAITDGRAASDPITAACILLLSAAALIRPRSALVWRGVGRAAIGLALVLILARIGDLWTGGKVASQGMPPFAAAAPLPAAFEVGTVAALLLLAAGGLLQWYRLARAAQILLAGAAAGFLWAMIGYVAQVRPFQHPTALFIGLAGAACAASLLASTADAGFLAELEGDQTHARLTRQGLAVSTIGMILIGTCIGRFCGSHARAAMIGEVLVFIAWIWGAAIVVTMRFNTIDRKRRLMEDDLRHDATTDGLTGLLNRNKMDELIAEHQAAVADAAVIMIDIDRFRSVNNALGTDAGDSLLVQAAKRLSNLADPHPVARAGGDDFAVFCQCIAPAAANRLAQAVVEAMAVPFRLGDDRQFHITASVGVAHGATEGIKELRYAADEAMHIAKTQGGNQSVPFVSAMHQARVERIGLEQDLHRACRSSTELFLVYQPIISLRDHRIVAVEALARWQHPQSGLVAPGRFVAVAETSGIFLGLGSKLRELAVTQAARWRDAAFEGLPVINLNVSPLELARSDVPGTLGDIIDRYGLSRSGFCLEVTEGSFADERALQSLHAARDAGFKVAMDDFGVGYSSLAQLPRLPLTSVKLDRSFLNQALESEDGISLLATTVQLVHVLKLPVVAEGVESREELKIASDCGCDSAQGFLFAHPLAPDELEPWLRPDHNARAGLAQARPAQARPAEAKAIGV